MTDRKLIIHYKVVNPLIFGVFDGTPHTKYVDAEMCCDDIDSLLGWMVGISSRPVDSPTVEIYSFSDYGPSPVGDIHFCPFCGAEIELKEVPDE